MIWNSWWKIETTGTHSDQATLPWAECEHEYTQQCVNSPPEPLSFPPSLPLPTPNHPGSSRCDMLGQCFLFVCTDSCWGYYIFFFCGGGVCCSHYWMNISFIRHTSWGGCWVKLRLGCVPDSWCLSRPAVLPPPTNPPIYAASSSVFDTISTFLPRGWLIDLPVPLGSSHLNPWILDFGRKLRGRSNTGITPHQHDSHVREKTTLPSSSAGSWAAVCGCGHQQRRPAERSTWAVTSEDGGRWTQPFLQVACLTGIHTLISHRAQSFHQRS